MVNEYARRDVEQSEKWNEWAEKIPVLKFPSTFLVQVIPPFGGAMIRFNIKDVDNPKANVSVYLDVFNQLGTMSGPYWEIYPDVNGDTFRYMMDDTKELINGIVDSLNAQLRSAIREVNKP